MITEIIFYHTPTRGFYPCPQNGVRITIADVVLVTSIPTSRVTMMLHCFRNRMLYDTPPPFTGIVEMDETYIGGQRKNKTLHIRRQKTKKGHGTEKLPIVGLFSRKLGMVYVDVLPKKLDMDYILKTVKERVSQGSTMYTDGFKMYRAFPRHGYPHEYVNHHKDEYVRGEVHTNNIEGFWGILKRQLGCIGGMRRDRLPYFIAEIVWKFNQRKKSLDERVERLIEIL